MGAARGGGGQRIGSLTLSKFECEASLEEFCNELQANPSAGFECTFRPILYAVLSKLIEWAESESPNPLTVPASRTLADCVRFLSGQQQKWMDTNPAFANRIKELAGVRLPDAAVTWLAAEYLDGNSYRVFRAAIIVTELSVANVAEDGAFIEA
jgi:hypothetical protein